MERVDQVLDLEWPCPSREAAAGVLDLAGRCKGKGPGERCANVCHAVLTELLTQPGPFLQQSDHHRGVAAADGTVQGPHAAVIHVLNHGTALHQIMHLQQRR